MTTLPLDLSKCIPPFMVWEQQHPDRQKQIVFKSFILKEANDVFEQKRRDLVCGILSLTDSVCHTIRGGARFPREAMR